MSDSGYADQHGNGPDEKFEAVPSASEEHDEEPGSDKRAGDLDAATVIAQRDEYLDSLRRLQAEFDNYRKRMVRQQTDLLERSTEALLVRLLPVLDAVDLALNHAGESGGDAGASFAQIAALLRDTIAKEGLERIDETDVPFDPNIHDAVAREPRPEDDVEEESGAKRVHETRVIDVMRPGYQLKGKVLRPAMVKVEG